MNLLEIFWSVFLRDYAATNLNICCTLFSGFILGSYDGAEPLFEYGYDLGCVAIAYKRNGRWVPLPVEASDYSNSAVQHFQRSA